MKKLAIIFSCIIMLCVPVILAGCSTEKDSGEIEYLYEFYGSMMYIDDDVSSTPEPEPIPERKIVRKGEELGFGLEVISITEDRIVIKDTYETYVGFVRAADGSQISDIEAGSEIQIKVGQKAKLDNCGICDASETITISYLG